jgi:hypothetical protein
LGRGVGLRILYINSLRPSDTTILHFNSLAELSCHSSDLSHTDDRARPGKNGRGADWLWRWPAWTGPARHSRTPGFRLSKV